MLREAGVPLGNDHAQFVIAYAYVPADELVPVTPSALAVSTESGAVMTAFSVRFVVHVAPEATYPPRPGRVQGVQSVAVLNVAAGASRSAHAATTFTFFVVVPALSRPPFETVTDTKYVPGVTQVGCALGVPVGFVSDAGLPLGKVHAHCVIGYAYVPEVEPVPLAPSAVPTTIESGIVATAFKVRFVVQVVPPDQ